MSSPWTLDRIFRFFLLLLLVGGLFVLLRHLSDVLVPFGVAFLLAYTLNPLVSRLQKRIPNRSVSVFLVLMTSAVLLIGIFYLLISPVRIQLLHAADLIRKAVTDPNFTHQISSLLPPALWEYLRNQLVESDWNQMVADQQLLQYATQALSRLAPKALSLVSGTLSLVLWFLGLTMILVYLFFMLLDFERLQKELGELIPSQIKPWLFMLLQDVDTAMSGYFRAQAMVSLTLAFFFAVGFSVIGLPLAIVFGICVGLMTMVPYLQLASIPIAALLALLQSVDNGTPFWQAALLVTTVYVVGQLLQDVILVPRIVGSASGLSPVMIMLSLSIWGQLLGLLGMIIAIPFTCVVLAYYRRLLSSRNKPSILSTHDSAEL